MLLSFQIRAISSSLDMPKTAAQRHAKQQLITVHHLKYAGRNLEPQGQTMPTHTVYYAFAGAIGGLLLILMVLIVVWCIQNHSYKRKLKAATTLAFGSPDVTVPPYDLPGTNLHSK